MSFDRGYGGLMGEEDDFFEPRDLSFIDPQARQPAERQPPAPVGMAVPGNVAPQQVQAPTWQPLAQTLTQQWQRAGIDPTMAGINRAEELAKILTNYGITDLSKLGLKDVAYTEYQPESYGEGENIAYTGAMLPTERTGKQLTYGDKVFGYLGGYGSKGQEEFGTQPYGLEERLQGPDLLAWSAAGKGNVSYRTVQAPNGQVYIVPEWGSSSDWGDFRQVAKLAAMMASAGGAGAALGASVLPAGVSTTVSGLLGGAVTPAAVSTTVGNAILGGIASGKPEGALLGGVASLLAPMVTSEITKMLPVEITGSEVIDSAIKSTAKNVTNAAVKSLITTGNLPDIGGIVQNTLLNEAGAAAQDSGFIPQNVDVNKLIKTAETVSKVIGGGEPTVSELFGLVSSIGSSLPKGSGGESSVSGGAAADALPFGGENAETLPGEDFAAERPLTESEIEEMLYSLEPGGGQAPMTQEELEQYLGIGPERVEVTGRRLQDLSFLPEDFGGFDTTLPKDIEDLILNAPTDQPADQQVEVVGKRLQDLEFVPSDLPALDTKLPENIKDLILNPPSAQPPSQQIEVTGQRLQDIAPLDIDLEAAKKAEDAIFNIPSAQAPAERIEVTGKREPVYDVPSLDVLEELLGGPQRIEITGKREPSDALYDVPDPGFLPELFGGPSELQRIPVTAPRKLEPIDLGLTFEEPGPLITPPDKLPEDLEKLITTPPAVTPAPAPSPRAPAPSPRPSPTPPPPSTGRPDLSGLFALLAMMGGKGGGGPEALQLANVAPGVEAGLRAIEEMYGSRRG